MATSFLLVNFLDEIRAEGYLKLVEPDTVFCVRPVLDLELSPVLSVGCTLSLRYFFTKASVRIYGMVLTFHVFVIPTVKFPYIGTHSDF